MGIVNQIAGQNQSALERVALVQHVSASATVTPAPGDPAAPLVVGGLAFTSNDTAFEPVRSNVERTLRAALTASANVTLSTINVNAKGAIFYFDIASFPGSASTTLALKVQGIDPAAGKAFVIAAGVARSASGLTTLVIYPDVLSAVSATKVTNFTLPRTVQCYVSQSSGATSKDVVWSLGMAFLP